MEVINVCERPEYKERAIAYFQKTWANEASMMVYEDCITRSLEKSEALPVWYLLMDTEEILGCVGLITNDFISRMELWPWLCALYVEEAHRGQNLSRLLIDQVKFDTAKMGFESVYLSTDHVGYYEKYDFDYIGPGYHPWGDSSRVYEFHVKERGES